MAIVRQGPTLEEFLALPEEKPALEYHEGVVTQTVAFGLVQSALLVELMMHLDRQLRPGKRAYVFPSLRTTYAGDSHMSHLAVYHRDRIPRDPGGRLVDEARTPPDLAVEIISPGQTLRELAATCRWYVDHGVQVALLVDDRDESVHAFRPNTPPTVHHRGQRVTLDEIAPDLHLDVDRIFDALDTDYEP
jgi:Uma2 family endonuclease